MSEFTIEVEIPESAKRFAEWFPPSVDLVVEERLSQITKWTEDDFDPHSLEKILTILAEEFGEIARAILEHDNDNLLEEIVQLTALGHKWIEHILQARKEQSNVTSTGLTSVGSIT